ncbi:MAG TPA: hypothetical protein ENI42_03025 [Thermoplasmatales archaeon]|nr:hypothetical protein [Thermoplasmatales archaeon]
MKLWDYDTMLRNGDDLLDQEHTVLWSSKTTVTFTIHCESKEGGCELYGPSGESGESGTDIFVTFYEHESAHVYVKCQQTNVEGELAINGLDTVTAGEEIDVTLSADQAVHNVTTAQWSINYDASNLNLIDVEIVHPILLMYELEKNFTYNTTEEGVVTFTLTETREPITLDGPLVLLRLQAKNNPSNLWDTTTLRYNKNTFFFNEKGEKIDVCLGGNFSIFLAPDDTTPPMINPDLIVFTQGKITGKTGAVTDDYDKLSHYLTVAVYNETGSLVAEDFVNQDGSFVLNNFFWLSNQTPSTFTVYNGVNLSTSYSFLPEPTAVPYILPTYQMQQQNITGKPGDTVQLSFNLLNKGDNAETYVFTVEDTRGWEFDTPFTRTLSPMENTTLLLNVTILAAAENQTRNNITLTMTSQTYPENTASATIPLTVYGALEEKPATSEKQTPGFEQVMLYIALTAIVLIWRQKRKTTL